MSGADVMEQREVIEAAVDAARSGDEAAFGALVERHRRELEVHCYRMLGSREDAEDQVQETFLRAWRRRTTYEGRSTLRAWLYRIATNACLDALERRPRTVTADGEVPWLQPFPDALLDGVAPADDEPEAVLVARETIELAYLVAIQHVPPRPRAVLILRDVLSWSARDTAELLDTTVASVNSALQRAHATLREHLPEGRADWAPGADAGAAERELLAAYVAATDRGDVEALKATLSEDVRFSMPPEPGVWTGRDTVVQGWVDGGFGSPDFGELRCTLTRANRQPAVACYRRRPGDDAHRLFALDVLRIEQGAVAEIVTFSQGLDAFGLPATI